MLILTQEEKLLGQISDLEGTIVDLYDADKVALLTENQLLKSKIKDLEFVILQARNLTQIVRRYRKQSDEIFSGFDAPLVGVEQEEMNAIKCFDTFYVKYVNPNAFKEEQ